MSSSKSLPPRVARLQQKVREAGAGAFLISKAENVAQNSGFWPAIGSMGFVEVVPAKGDPILIVNALRREAAEENSFLKDVRSYAKWFDLPSDGETYAEVLKNVIAELGLSNATLGIESTLSLKQHDELKRILPDANLIQVSEAIEDIRIIKDEDQVADLHVAGALADHGAKAGVPLVKPGAMEYEVQAAVLGAINQMVIDDHPGIKSIGFGSSEGGVHAGHQCWVISGPRRSQITPHTSGRKLENGDLVTIGIWAVCNGMHVEKEITVVAGTPRPEDVKTMKIAYEARAAAFAILKPGATVGQVFDEPWKVMKRRGVTDDQKPSRDGHTVGFGPHEKVSLTPGNSMVMEEGFAAAVEPHVFHAQGKFSQFSDTIVITKDSFAYLTKPFPLAELGFE